MSAITEDSKLLPEAQVVGSLQFLAVSEATSKQMPLYEIEVKSRGCHMAVHTVQAVDALTAINMVERYYGEPVEVETAMVEDEHGSRRQTLVVKNWHGYTFDARAIKP